MKVIKLVANNYKRLKAIELTFRPGLTHVTGPNDSGKSSALDTFLTVLGGKRVAPSDPVRHGTEGASIELDYEGKFIAKWSCKAGGEPRLVLESPDGARYLQPQKLLDEMYEEIALEPSKFERMKPSQQRDILAEITGLKAPCDALDKEIAEVYAQRTGVNRDLKRAAMLLADRATEPVDAVDVGELLGQLEQGNAYNAALEALDKQLAEYAKQADERRAKAADLRERARRMLDEAARLGAEAGDLDATRNQYAAGRGEVFDTAPIREALQNAEATNVRHRQHLETLKLAQDVADLEAESAALSARIDAAEDAKAALVATAKMPIDGLTLGAEGILYHGVPLEQASQAQRMRVIIAIGVALNPKVKIILLRDASLLDSKTLGEMAADPSLEEYFVICETVDETKSRGIVMEDGGVIAIDGELIPLNAGDDDGE